MRVQELFDLSGKVAIVTGGGSGLGRQMAEALAECGADLVLCARRADRCEEAAQELAGLGVRALGLACDVRNPEDVDAVVRRAVAELGRVDILVNNAGTAWGAPPEDMPLDGWQKVLDVNLTGLFLFAQTVGRVLIEQGDGGRIVNVASVAAFRGAPQAAMNAIPYNASKAGVVGLTIDLAVKWAQHGITVNAIAPGWFPSEMTKHTLDAAGDRLLGRVPLGRYGGPDDLKGAVVYLSSAASAYVTGTTLVVDGGQMAS
ncbi:MAG TPA: SDR family oxidoreductase [Gaiellaceae bacterium]|nr:SDR family oxidoreductase [Gaiellaceae bacterium]